MNEPNSDNNQDQVLCCQSLVDDNDKIKKLKPILNAGILIYFIILVVDLLYLNTRNLITYLFLCLCVCMMSFNKCFLIFQLYTIISITILDYIIRIKYLRKNKNILKTMITLMCQN